MTSANDPTDHALPIPAIPPRWPQIGRYRVLERIGRGGYGEVYRARREDDQQVVALKILRPNTEQEEEMRRRFQVEAHLAMAVDDPQVVAYLDLGQESGWHFLAMELVDGGDAAELPFRHGNRVPQDQILRIGADAARGLGALHRRGLLHRDVKPSNLFLTREGGCKVGDLGLVIQLGDGTSITLAGNVVGTPEYIAPEQARDDPALDHRADLFSLASSLYFLSTGRSPFQAATIWATLARLMSEPFPDPRILRPELSPMLAAVILCAGDKDPARRYVDAQAMAEDLAAVAAGRPPQAGLQPIRGTRIPTCELLVDGPRILLVDDDPLIRRIHASRLRIDGFQVDVAADAPAALAAAAAAAPAAVVLDLKLGEGDGLVVLERLRQHPQHRATPVLVFSNAFDEAHLARAHAAGVNAILSKAEVTPKALGQRLKQLLEPTAERTGAALAQGRSGPVPVAELLSVGTQVLVRIARLVSALGAGDATAQHQALTEITAAAAGLSAMAGAAGAVGTALLADATAELARQLQSRPGRVTASSRHTLAQALAGLQRLLVAGITDWSPQPALVVDDDPASLRLASAALAKVRIDSLTEFDPRAAARLAATRPIGLLVTDVLMDGCNGPELVRLARASPGNARVPVIYVTSLADFARQLPSDGMPDDVIAKPYLVMELAVKALVHQVCR